MASTVGFATMHRVPEAAGVPDGDELALSLLKNHSEKSANLLFAASMTPLSGLSLWCSGKR